MTGSWRILGAPEGSPVGGWAFRFNRGPNGDKFKLDELLAAEAMLLGRRTYEGFAAVWPSITDDIGFADKMNSMPKFVVTTTRETLSWNNSTRVQGEVIEAVKKLKRDLSGDILVAGSSQLVQSLHDHGLIDEYRLMVFPVVHGSGKRLFKDASAGATLSLGDVRAVGECAVMVLHPAKEAATAT